MSSNIYYRNIYVFYFYYLNINKNLDLLYNKYDFYNKINLNFLHKYFQMKNKGITLSFSSDANI